MGLLGKPTILGNPHLLLESSGKNHNPRTPKTRTSSGPKRSCTVFCFKQRPGDWASFPVLTKGFGRFFFGEGLAIK